jgi:hypothetical protein
MRILTGSDVRSLMRKHGWTIKALAAAMGLTQKRVREVRADGVRGPDSVWEWDHALAKPGPKGAVRRAELPASPTAPAGPGRHPG